MSRISTSTSTATADSPAVGKSCTSPDRVTRSLLGFGVIAGPFYVTVSLVQAAVRDGFDLSRHAWSQLANGPGGWVQIVNLIVTGLMVMAAAVGYRRAWTTGVGRRWAPRLLATFGLGMVAAGIFPTDPMAGFPMGTPDGPPVAPTLSGLLHLVCAGVGFLALIVATLVVARRFRSQGRTGRAVWSVVTGIAFLLAFVGLASGGSSPAVILPFVAAILLTWTWLSATSFDVYTKLS